MFPSASRYNKARHDYGIANQTALVPFLESYLKEQITQTTKFYDTIDGQTATKDIEIKSRTPNYHYNLAFMKPGWLVPACKIRHAKTSGRPFHCFYYWKADESVWEFIYSEEAMWGLKPFIPSWHRDEQEHYLIPQNRWRCIRPPKTIESA